MLKILATVALSTFLVANAPAPAPAEKPAGNSTAQTDNRKYCITMEPSTESRISKRKCMTKSQWAEMGVKVDEAQK